MLTCSYLQTKIWPSSVRKQACELFRLCCWAWSVTETGPTRNYDPMPKGTTPVKVWTRLRFHCRSCSAMSKSQSRFGFCFVSYVSFLLFCLLPVLLWRSVSPSLSLSPLWTLVGESCQHNQSKWATRRFHSFKQKYHFTDMFPRIISVGYEEWQVVFSFYTVHHLHVTYNCTWTWWTQGFSLTQQSFNWHLWM